MAPKGPQHRAAIQEGYSLNIFDSPLSLSVELYGPKERWDEQVTKPIRLEVNFCSPNKLGKTRSAPQFDEERTGYAVQKNIGRTRVVEEPYSKAA